MPACPTLFRTPSHYRLGSDAQSVLRVLPHRLPFHSLSFLVKPSPLIHTSASIAVGIPKNDLRFPCAMKTGFWETKPRPCVLLPLTLKVRCRGGKLQSPLGLPGTTGEATRVPVAVLRG